MGLDALQPANTQRARATAVKVFAKFIKEEGVEQEYVCECIANDKSGQVFVSVIDKFGTYLAFCEVKDGKPLARHSCMQYYRQAKHWLLDKFPQHRAVLEAKLLKMGRTLESFCLKRKGGGFVKKANACTKDDLKRMMLYMYENGRTPSDYQDSCLLSLLWFMFGRASDVTHVRKQNVSVDTSNVFFVRFVRVKTSEEQGLSLFPDSDYTTCPLLAIALALATQTSPNANLIGNLPTQPASMQLSLADEPPLAELLLEGAALSSAALRADGPPPPTAPSIHSHVNRLLGRITRPAGVIEQLTSHSFRRGGAQHANSSFKLNDRWIFDRGAWNITTTNKALNYVFNTRQEDHKVSKVLSGRDPADVVPLPDLAVLDAQSLERVAAVQDRLLAACSKLSSARFCVVRRALDVLTAVFLLHYPTLKQKHPNSLAVQCLEQCALDAQCSLVDLLAWSSCIASPSQTQEPTVSQQQREQSGHTSNAQNLITHKSAVIEQLVRLVKRQDRRLDALEARAPIADTSSKKKVPSPSDDNCASAKRQRRATTLLSATWFHWFCSEPRLWDLEAQRARGDDVKAQRQRKSDAKTITAYMKLFVDELTLNENAETYRDDVMALGLKAEQGVASFLASRNVAAKGSQSVLKHMHRLHKAGELNDLIAQHKRRLAAGTIVDPSPAFARGVLQPVYADSQE